MSPSATPPADSVESTPHELNQDSQVLLLEKLTQITEKHLSEYDFTMTFAQAMQAASRCQALLDQEQEVYAYFRGILAGTSEMTTLSMATDAKDYQGRPVIAKIPIAEILAEEIPNEETRAKAIQPLFAAINNYYAKRVTRWVKQLTVYMAIASTKMPST